MASALITQSATLGVSAATNFANIIAGIAAQATESRVQIKERSAGSYSQLTCMLSGNATTLASTLKFRKNGANGNQSVSVGAGATGTFTDAVNTDAVVAGDTTDYQWTPGSANNATFTVLSVVFSETTNTSTHGGSAAIAVTNLANATKYMCLMGAASDTVEANCQNNVQVAGTTKNLCVKVYSARASSATTVGSRIGGANGNQSVSCTAGTTGFFEDTVDTDSVAAGTLCGLYATTGAGTDTMFATVSDQFETTTGYSVSGGRNLQNISTTTVWFGIGGVTSASGSEANVAVTANIASVAASLWIYVSANTTSGSFSFRKNQAATTLSASIGSNLTGAFSDLTDSVSFAASDTIDLQVNAVGNTITTQGYSLSLGFTPAAAGAPKFTVERLSMPLNLSVGGPA